MIHVAKTKALISCKVTAQLICVFVFAYMQKAGFLMTRLNYCQLLEPRLKERCLLYSEPGKTPSGMFSRAESSWSFEVLDK